MMSGPVVTIEDVTVLRETDKAILCEWDGKEHWVPKSQISDDSPVQDVGDEGSLVVSEWWATKSRVL